jgi:hypothetical protein
MQAKTPSPLVVLAADMMARELKLLMDHVALGSYRRYFQLKESLSAYAELRAMTPLVDPDPQRMNVNACEPAPTTQRSEVRS